jgi:hypothetical protein
MASTISLLTHLPAEVLASVLGKFSRGKTISTFLMVACSHRELRPTAYSLCRGALVQRYIELSTHPALVPTVSYSEIRDVLDVIREDIRLSNDDDDQMMAMFSEWCAILDYFEIQLEATNPPHFRCPQWIIWCGQLGITYGRINAYLATPDWSVCALQYWRNQELLQFTLTHPRHTDYAFISEDRIPYGTLIGLQNMDRLRLERQCSDLEVHALRDVSDPRRFCLVPLNESYDECPSIVFVDHSFICHMHSSHILVGPLLVDPERRSLCCCWEKEIGEDLWDLAISNFGQHAIRVMSSFGSNFSTEMLLEMYRNTREFSNHG